MTLDLQLAIDFPRKPPDGARWARVVCPACGAGLGEPCSGLTPRETLPEPLRSDAWRVAHDLRHGARGSLESIEGAMRWAEIDGYEYVDADAPIGPGWAAWWSGDEDAFRAWVAAIEESRRPKAKAKRSKRKAVAA